MTSVLKKTVHKGSRSIDFINHNLKTSITQPKRGEIEKSLDPVNNISPVKNIKVYDHPIHPFHRPSAASKLIKVLRPHNKLDAGPIFSLESHTKGGHKVNLSPSFNSSREAIAFLDKLPQDYQILNPIEQSPVISNLSESAKSQIEEMRTDDVQSWSKILKARIVSKDGSIITNEDKLVFLLEKTINRRPESVSNAIPLLKSYITFVENSKLVSNISQFFLHQVLKYEYENPKQILKEISEIEKLLADEYPGVKKEPSFINVLLKTHLHLKEYEGTKLLIDSLIAKGFTPDAETFEMYLKFHVDKLISSKTLSVTKNAQVKADFFDSIIDMDDVFHSVMNPNIAKLLLHGSGSLEEASSILRQLQSKIQGQELKDAYKSFEVRMVNIMNQEDRTFVPHILQSALRNTFYQKHERVTEFANRSNVILLNRTVRYGSLIFATKLLEKVRVSPDDINGLSKILEQREFETINDSPGYDTRSRDAFLERLNAKSSL